MDLNKNKFHNIQGDVLLKDKNYTELHKLCDKALKIKGLTTAQKEKMTKRIETCKKENIKQAEKHKAMCARMFKPLNTPPKGKHRFLSLTNWLYELCKCKILYFTGVEDRF